MTEPLSPSNPIHWCKVILRGIGQIVFQDHATTGLFFVVGIALASPLSAAGAVLGSILGMLTAIVLKYDRKEINDGIYGFNASLVGLGLLFYMDDHMPYVWALVVVGSVISTVVTYLCRRYLPFPTYTAPFIVTTWFIIIAVHGIVGKDLDHVAQPMAEEYIPKTFIEEVFAGNAEIMFRARSITGILFVIGVAISDWRHGFLVFMGSLIGTLTAIYHHDENQTIAIGIYGYNAALAAVGITLWRKSLLVAILAAIVSVPITEFFPDLGGRYFNVAPLTSPFVIACWLVLAMGMIENQFYGIDFTKMIKRAMAATTKTEPGKPEGDPR